MRLGYFGIVLFFLFGLRKLVACAAGNGWTVRREKRMRADGEWYERAYQIQRNTLFERVCARVFLVLLLAGISAYAWSEWQDAIVMQLQVWWSLATNGFN